MRADLKEVLDRTRVVLADVRMGADDLAGADPTRRLPGLRNVAVFGRSVTFALQKARGCIGSQFDDEFYSAQQAKLAAWEDAAKLSGETCATRC